MARPKELSEACELGFLLGYLAEFQQRALLAFQKEDISSEEAIESAIREWNDSTANLDRER